MEEFAGINRAMEKTGTFTMHRKKLFQLVGKANSNLADVILRVGLFDRYSIKFLNLDFGSYAQSCGNNVRLRLCMFCCCFLIDPRSLGERLDMLRYMSTLERSMRSLRDSGI